MIANTLEYYWIPGNEENKLTLPDHEQCFLSSYFLKKIGEGDIFEECQLKIYPNKLYLL